MFFRRKKERIYDKLALFVISTLVICVGIVGELLKGTNAALEMPVNIAFDDINFYKCVVSAYNLKNGTSFEYDTNLTDEQLKTITMLSCSGQGKVSDNKIKSIRGIEKLTELTYINVSDNLLTELDVSQNKKVQILQVQNNVLDKLDVSQNTEINDLYVYNNELVELDVSQNLKLETLYISHNRIVDIDLSKNVELLNLFLNNNRIIDIDLSKNIKLTNLNLSYNGLFELDLSNNEELKTFELMYGFLTELDLSNNTKLESISIPFNNLKKINMSKNSELMEVLLYSNSLTSLDVSKNLKLEYLIVDYNRLTTLDVSNNVNLIELSASVNKLTELDLSKNKKLEYLMASQNKITSLDLSNNSLLEEVTVEFPYDLEITLSNDIEILDLFSFFGYLTNIKYLDLGNGKVINIDSNYDYYAGYSISVNEITTVSSFIENLGLSNLYAKVYRSDIELTSGNISYGDNLKIFDNNNNLIEDVAIFSLVMHNDFKDEEFYQCVLEAYNDENNANLPYTYILSDEELETITKLDCSLDMHIGSYIYDVTGIDKLKSLEVLNLAGQIGLSEIDVSENKNLKEINVSYNRLTSLDVSQNLELETLIVSGNELTSLDVTKNKDLATLIIDTSDYDYYISSKNEISSLDVSQNLELNYLEIFNNELDELDVSKNEKLKYLSVDFNNLKELDTSKNQDLVVLFASKNELSELDVSNNINLENLSVGLNELSQINVSQNKKLKNLSIYNNNLTNIDVSNNLLLAQLYVSDNKLRNLDLSINDNLNILEIFNNPFAETLYVYKGSNVSVGNNVKVPIHLNWDKPVWESTNKDVVSVSMDGVVNGIDSGSADIIGKLGVEYMTTSTINVVEITSDKYVIDQVNNVIISFDTDEDVIKNNINISHENVELNVDMDKLKLQIVYNNDILKEFDILALDFGNLSIDNNIITISNEISYDDFVGNITINSDLIRYEIMNGELLVENGNITNGMRLIIYYNEDIVGSYDIMIYEISFNDNILIDDGSKFVKYKSKKQKSTVEEFLENISLNGSGEKIVVDSKNNKKINSDYIATGDILYVYVGNKKVEEYKIAVRGDISGDGKISLLDLAPIRKSIAGTIDETTGEIYKLTDIYFYAANINDDNKISLMDLGKLRKLIVGSNID